MSIVMAELFVTDATSLISYYSDVFQKPSQISREALNLIDRALLSDPAIRLSVPSIVFVEIFEKWFKSEEFAAKIRSEVFEPINNASNIEIKPLEQEVLENFIEIKDDHINLENHDKIILASAMMLNCSLITSDSKIIKYVKKYKVIPRIVE